MERTDDHFGEDEVGVAWIIGRGGGGSKGGRMSNRGRGIYI